MLVLIQTSHLGNTSKTILICNNNSECQIKFFLSLHPKDMEMKKYRDWYIITVLGIYITRTIDDAEDEFQGHTEQNGSTYEGLIVFTI